MNRDDLDAAYYQRLHDNHPAFQANNWLTQDLDTLKQCPSRSLLELGCGNGRFLSLAAAHWEHVVGVDWARSPVLGEVVGKHPNVSFVQADILAWTPANRFDLVVSADFLEHLSPEHLPHALARFHAFGKHHYHRIACYDDGHSHLSIFSPDQWLGFFESVAPGIYQVLSVEARKGNVDKLVITIGNLTCHDRRVTVPTP